MKKWIWGLSIFFSIIIITLATVLYFVQEQVIFNPDKLSEQFVFSRGEEVEIKVDEDVFLNCLLLKTPRSKGVILYLHGNRGSNKRALFQAENLRGNQYDVLIVDYRGYGKSDGNIYSEAQLYEDIQKVYNYLKHSYDESQIAIVGYSLGSGMASFLAATNQPQQLILVAPYQSMIAMKDLFLKIAPDFLLKYKLDNESHVARVTCPVTIFHGTADELIPYSMAETLQQVNPNNIELVKMPGIGHRSVIFNSRFTEGVSQLLK